MRGRVLIALACLAAAPGAEAVVSLGVEMTIGGQHLGLTRAPGSREPLATVGDLGAMVLARLGPLAIGAAAEGTFAGRKLRAYDASALAGLVTDLLPVLRLELLGELGAANLRPDQDLSQVIADGHDRFYGFRPGLSARLPNLPIRAGLWGIARWGLDGSARDPALGVLGRMGIEF